MINTIIEEGLVDRQYIEKNTQGYRELKEHIKDFTPEEMSNMAVLMLMKLEKLQDYLPMLNPL